MAHQYVSLNEAAAILKLSEAEVNALREQGDLRGFADRGTWKFRKDAVEDYARFRSTGSDPDVPVLGESGPDAGDLFRTHDMSDSKPDVLDHLGDDDSDATGSLADGSDDSSGFLLGDESPRSGAATGDSGRFKLGDLESGIFSDGADDSGINLVPDEDGVTVGGVDSGIALDLDGESGVLVPGSTPDADTPNDFDESDGVFDKTVTFDDKKAPAGADLESTALFDDESGLALDLGGEASDVTLDGDESGIALDLAEESGITLDDAGDSGIALDLGGDESGLALDFGGDSALEAGDSGIALDFADSEVVAPSGIRRDAVPAADLSDETLDFVPGDDDGADSEFDLGASEQSLEIPVESEGLGELADGDEFDEIEDDFDDELDGEVDEYDDEYDDFDESGPAGDQFEDDVERPRAGKKSRQSNWGTATFAGLVLCSLVMGVTGLVTWQSMRQMWDGQASESVLDPVVDAVTGMIP